MTLFLLACTGATTEVIEGNIPPSVVLLVPMDQGELVDTEQLVFSVLVSDDQDSPLELQVAWTWEDGTPVEGQVALLGDVLTLSLESPGPGSHQLLVSATDSDGELRAATASFTLVEPELVDRDGDGFGDAALGGQDCDDDDATIHPDATERCNGLDDDCDGQVDQGLMSLWYPDLDGDGFGDEAWARESCLPPTEDAVAEGGDCDDRDPAVHPAGVELCNGLDDDCNGSIDDDPAGGGWWADQDGDGFGDPGQPLESCDSDEGGSLDPTDCRDDRAGQVWCMSCQDLELQGQVSSAGTYTLFDADGQPFETLCDPDRYGGGWTLVATNTRDGDWLPPHVLDRSSFGVASVTEDFKSIAWSSAPFEDLLFENNGEYALYESVGDGSMSWWAFQAQVPAQNCGGPDSFGISEGNLSGPGLCDQDLYVHPAIWASGQCTSYGMGWGPTWRVKDGDQCMRAPHTTSFLDDPLGMNPWGKNQGPLRVWVR